MSDIIDELGTDAAKWCAKMVERGVVKADPAPGDMFHVWMCNAIEIARAEGYSQGQKEALAQQPQDEDEKPLMDDALLKKMSDNVTKLDDHRPHMTFYGACMACGRDVVVVCPVGTKNLECAHCHKPAVERVQIHDAEWFDRYMNGAKTKKQRDMRTMVLLNAKRMGL